MCMPLYFIFFFLHLHFDAFGKNYFIIFRFLLIYVDISTIERAYIQINL